MPYILNKTNGTVLAIVADGSINQTTNLTFVGKNYAGYGEFFNENMLKLLENFANSTAPSKAITGQIWYDSSSRRLKVYDGSNFSSVPYNVVAGSPPKNLNIGDFWFNSSEKRLYVKSSATEFTMIGPTASGAVNSSIILASVIDSELGTRYVLKHTINGNLIAVTSNDEFVPGTGELNNQFSVVKQGLTLTGADSATGVTSNNGYYFWGTAAHALRLGNHAASEFLLTSTYNAGVASGLSIDTDNGITVGSGLTFKFHAGPSTGKITLIEGTKISFYLNIADVSTNVISIFGNALVPGTIAANIGASTSRFSTVYANAVSFTSLLDSNSTSIATFDTDTTLASDSDSKLPTQKAVKTYVDNIVGGIGAVTNANYLYNGAQNAYIAASQSALHDTIVERDGSSNIYANVFYGTASQALFADLAERYHADDIYDEGTVLIIGGDNEVTTTHNHADAAVAGIVSKKPAYLMNADAGTDDTHPCIALKGRVPCKVIGAVNKGDLLVTSNGPGYAEIFSAEDDPNSVIGKALESFQGYMGIIEVKV